MALLSTGQAKAPSCLLELQVLNQTLIDCVGFDCMGEGRTGDHLTIGLWSNKTNTKCGRIFETTVCNEQLQRNLCKYNIIVF